MEAKKNIYIISNVTDGLYCFRYELIHLLASQHNVTILATDTGFADAWKKAGCNFVPIHIDRRGTNVLSDLRLLFRYCHLFKQGQPSVVLSYTIKPNVYGGIACRLTRTPYITNVTGLGTAIENGGLLSRLTLFLYKNGLKKANCIFFQNASNMNLFVQKHIAKGNMHLIPGSGVNLQRHIYENYPTESEKIRFLFIGRIMKAKGIDELLKAMHMVHEKYPAASLDIIGGCDEDYQEILKEAEHAGYIRYHGKQADVRPFIKNCHCTVLPSYHEGTANVMLESASTGRPVITTRVPGCCETFDEGVTGFGCDAKDPQGLADAMMRFIELPYNAKIAMGRAGRKKMEKEFDRQIVIDAYMDEIDKIINH